MALIFGDYNLYGLKLLVSSFPYVQWVAKFNVIFKTEKKSEKQEA